MSDRPSSFDEIPIRRGDTAADRTLWHVELAWLSYDGQVITTSGWTEDDVRGALNTLAVRRGVGGVCASLYPGGQVFEVGIGDWS